MNEPLLTGLILRMQSGFYQVEIEGQTVVCQLRGRLKRGRRDGDLLSVGDHVEIAVHSDGSGSIETILPRQSAFVRLDPRPFGVYRQILLSNPSQVVLVYACANPSPHLRMVDRLLVVAEKQQIPAVIVANKADLVSEEEAHAIFDRYPPLGYPVIYTSAALGSGLDAFRACLTGKISALAGPSGVGKSSLLNAIQPDLGLAVREISQGGERGKHTTVVRQLFPLVEGGYVADLPGLRGLALWDTQPEELDGYFPELRELVQYCQFNDCTHRNEPGCAVRRALAEGEIHPERYESYLRMRFSDKD